MLELGYLGSVLITPGKCGQGEIYPTNTDLYEMGQMLTNKVRKKQYIENSQPKGLHSSALTIGPQVCLSHLYMVHSTGK